MRVGRKRRVEREIELRKVGGEGKGEREEVMVYGGREGAVVRQVEVVEGREGEGKGGIVEGEAGKGWSRWWTR